MTPNRGPGTPATLPSFLLAAVLLVLISLACIHASAQSYVFNSYRQAEGLGNLSISGLAFDQTGFLWIGTENGVYRLVGSRFERFGVEQGIRERAVLDVSTDQAGRVWAITGQNLYRWNGRDFEPFQKFPTPILGNHRIASPDPRHLIVIRRRELVEFELDSDGRPLSERPLLSPQQIRANPALLNPTTLAASPDGTLWFGCESSLCSLIQGQLKVWSAAEGVPALVANQDFWRALLVDTHGSLWAASARETVELTRGSERFQNRHEKWVEMNGTTILSPILEDRSGGIFRATDDGLARWDGAAWRAFGQGNGLDRNSPITSLALDRSGDLWMGTGGGGLRQWAGSGNWEGWTTRDGLPDDSIWSFAWSASGSMLIGTEKGPAQLDAGAHRMLPFFLGPHWSHGQVSSIVTDRKGQVWLGTWNGRIVRIDPKSRREHEVADIQWVIYDAVVRPDGGLLFLTKNGVYSVDHPETSEQVKRDPEVSGMLGQEASVGTHCAMPNGDLWLVGKDSLLALRSGHWQHISFASLGIPGSDLLGVGCGHSGDLWVTGLDRDQESGVWKMEQRAGSLKARQLHTPEFLHAMVTNSILVDRRGWLWIGTDVGVVVFNGTEWRHFTLESGLIWNDSNQAVLREAPDGSIWLGTSGGAAHLLHPETSFNTPRENMTILSVGRSQQTFLPGQRAEFAWSRMPIRVEFASPAGWNRRALEFRYRPLGSTQPWSTTTDSGATLPVLFPGTYRYEVLARDSETGISSIPAAVGFRVLAPWWLRWWMIALYLLLLAVCLWLLLWLRTRKLLAARRRLESLVLARTQELEVSREALRIQSVQDALTSLLNRRGILDELTRELERQAREGGLLAVLLLDIDHFKRINDSHGHLAGDTVLKTFGELLKDSIRSYDSVGRYGGEEFLILVRSVPSDGMPGRVSKIHSKLTNLKIVFEGREMAVTTSIGVSIVGPGLGPFNPNQILSAADRALYEAKRAGRNCVVLAERAVEDRILPSTEAGEPPLPR